MNRARAAESLFQIADGIRGLAESILEDEPAPKPAPPRTVTAPVAAPGDAASMRIARTILNRRGVQVTR